MKQLDQINSIFSEVRQTAQAVQQMNIEVVENINLAEFQKFVESLQIITKYEGRKSLIMRKEQEIVWHSILADWEARKPPSKVCCKARRLGISTLIEGISFGAVTIYPGKFAQVVAQDWKASANIFRMAKRFYTYLPKEWKERRPLASDTNKIILYSSPHDSQFSVATANNPSLASSELIHFLHLSEVAKYKDPPAFDAITSIQQCIPNHWFTLQFWESTAFGKYGLFYDHYQGAKEGDMDMDPIFLSWRGFPEYYLAPPSGWHAGWTPEEKEYQTKYNLSDGEMLWATTTRKKKCQNRWPEFHQEYPIVDDVAFKWTGHPWFDAEAMEDHKAHQRVPIRKGTLEFASDTDPIVEFKEAV